VLAAVRNDYPSISNKAVKVSLPFVKTYLCETGFSDAGVMKTKYRSRLIIEKERRVAISSMTRRIGKM
jgi:hypothetical protein